MGSSTILFALLEHRVRKISRMEGRGAPMIFAAESEYEMHRVLEGHEKILPTASNMSCDKTRRNCYPENLTLE